MRTTADTACCRPWTARGDTVPPSPPARAAAGGDKPATSQTVRAAVDEIVRDTGRSPDALISILQAIQTRYNYLPEEALRRIPEIADITAADIAGVSTFYNQFRHRPAGRHFVRVCVGTACHVRGADRVIDAVRRRLQIPEGEDTDRDGLFTVTAVACLGCCTLAPAVQIDDVTYGHLAPTKVEGMLRDFLEQQRRRDAGGPPPAAPALPEGEIRVGQGSCCVAGGSREVWHGLEAAVRETGAAVRIRTVGCVGMCHQTPLVEVVDRAGRSTLYAKVSAGETRRIVARHFRPAGPARSVRAMLRAGLERCYTDEEWEPVERYAIDVRDPPVSAFLGRQRYVAAEHRGEIEPLDLEDCLARGGFGGLRGALAGGDPAAVIETVRRSGLRGRGGAGFPAGEKWGRVRAQPGTEKYVVMNGDEGDPGAFMDRMLLESYPYRVLEGIAVAAFAVGAHEGVLYIRAEYPLAVQRVRAAIARAEARGLLGPDILGSGFGLRLRVMEGAGAFVCGEETALLASIEGRRGMPRFRPPYPAERGLHGRPTLINNVETYACVPWILREGPAAFAALGTAASKGTKVFSLTGKVRRGGLIEVPMGITIREIVEEIGGGVAEGRRFKAVQIGGPSGGCIPAEQGDLPIDYEALTHAGAIMGSGGLVVLDDTDCMVDVARYFLQFTQAQSCGKCTFCRIGTKRMLEILERLCAGEGRAGDVEELEHLGQITRVGSLCALGGTAPNPVLSTIRNFRDEYEAHIAGRCPARRCKQLIRYVVTDKCIGCTRCAQQCPVNAIPLRPYRRHEIDASLCSRCDTCRPGCPAEAIEIVDARPAPDEGREKGEG
ncbi:MAG: 4Fe-4S dicluster domain-containing protein [Lentisphaerae bacterium]|nr:4Fe-4S dicluster domain-containing protein [Lentisphaerota bacterium]